MDGMYPEYVSAETIAREVMQDLKDGELQDCCGQAVARVAALCRKVLQDAEYWQGTR